MIVAFYFFMRIPTMTA